MRLFALIGYPLGHSFSERYFTEKFEREGIPDARYELFPLEQISDLPVLLAKHHDLQGLNVTIPYKEAVLPYLQTLDETARAAGAVNCILVRDGRLSGYNTDVYGFEKSLLNWQTAEGRRINKEGHALILGTGGASKAVAYVLKKLGIDFQFVSRSPSGHNQIEYAKIPFIINHSSFIINTTPLGMAPHTDQCPDLPYHQLGPQHFVYDLIYNPTETLLLCRAKAQGCAIQNGLAMLHLQAEKSWEIWNVYPS